MSHFWRPRDDFQGHSLITIFLITILYSYGEADNIDNKSFVAFFENAQRYQNW